MEQEEDRKKKVAAGKEKLAAFRRKRAKKKKAQGDGGEGGMADGSHSNGTGETNLVDVSSASDFNSVTGESDQFSLTSGDEWSAEEPELHSAVFYQAKLAAATQRIAELEEAVEGKQLALDSMVQEMQSPSSPLSHKYPAQADASDGGDGKTFETRGTVFDLHEAVAQRDKILRQLTNRLQETATSAHSRSQPDGTLDYSLETERLSQQVAVLQQQLAQAGETLHQQTEMCQMSVQALQGAKDQILNLQVKVTEKNNLLQQLTQELASKTSKLAALQGRESELEALVKRLQAEAAIEAESCQIVANAAQGDASRVQVLEEELEMLANQQEESAQALAELQQRLDASEAARQAQAVEKEELLQKLSALEAELQELGEARDSAFQRMSDLEQQVDEKSVAVMEAEADARDADARVTQLESEAFEMNAKHRLQIEELNQSNTALEILLAERSSPSASDMSDLKNRINSQQNEILTLRSQLQDAEEQTNELEQQLEEVQRELSSEREKAESVVRKYEQEIEELIEEKTGYKQTLENLEHQVRLFKEDHEALQESSVEWMKDTRAELSDKPGIWHDQSGTQSDVVDEVTTMFLSYRELLNQWGHLADHNKHLQDEASNTLETLSEQPTAVDDKNSIVQSLQCEVRRLRNEILKYSKETEEKDSQIQAFQSHLETITKENTGLQEQLQQQISETESQILESDTQQRKLLGRISTLCSEVADYKEALKESETAHLALEEKFGTLLAEADSLRLQAKDTQRLQEEVKHKDQELATVVAEKQEVVSRLESIDATHQSEVKALQFQLNETVQLQSSVQSQSSVSWESQAMELEEQLKLKTTELENLLTSNEEISNELASIQTKHGKELRDIQMKLEEKAKELDDISAQNWNLSEKLQTIQNAHQTEIQTMLSQLEEKSQELHEVMKAREELASTGSVLRQQLEEAQHQLVEKTQECQTISSQVAEVALQLETTQNTLGKEIQVIQEQLQAKTQECQIITSENEQLLEQLQSSLAVSGRETQILKSSVEQKSQELETLMSERDCLRTQLESQDSTVGKDLQDIQQMLQEKVVELQAKETALHDTQTHLEQVMEELAAAETASAEASQLKEQELGAHQRQIEELEKELVSLRDEKEVLASQISTQTEMFKVKEEEMVAENNSLNQQLEEVRSEVQETVGQHQSCEKSLQEELDTTKHQLQTKEEELTRLAEQVAQQNGELEAQAASVSSLLEEKNQLLLKLSGVETSAEDVQSDLHARINTLQAEITGLQSEVAQKTTEFDQEMALMLGKQNDLQQQLETSSAKIEQLQKSLDEAQAELAAVRSEKESLLQQHEALQAEFSAELQDAQSKLASRESELQSLNSELKETAQKLKTELETAHEELSATRADFDQKDLSLETMKNELAAMKSQVERATEEKEMLKNNFDCCMEEMTQRASEQDDTIRQLQSRLVETSHNTDRDHGQLREIYESQLSEVEERLADSEAEVIRLKDIIAGSDAEREKLKESYYHQITELDLSVQAMESEKVHEKERADKLVETHEKEIMDLKHSYEIQIASVEENCQCLEKALAKQDTLMSEMSAKFELEKAEREKSYEQQLSEAYERARMYEMDVGKVKRQLEEMRKDHQKEREELQKDLETQIFDLENKCSIAISERDRMRQSLWTMEEDFGGEKQSLGLRIQELEELCHSQEKQTSDLQDKLIQSSQQSEENISSLKESFQAEVSHMEEQNQQLTADLEQLQDQLKTADKTYRQELEALKHQHAEEMSIVQEKCRQAEVYSHMLQSHMDSASAPSENPELLFLRAENERLKQQLAVAEAGVQDLQRQLREAHDENENRQSELQKQVSTLVSEKEEKDEKIKHLLGERRRAFEGATSAVQGGHLSADRSMAEGQQRATFVSHEFHYLPSSVDETTYSDESRQKLESDGGFEPEPDSLEYLDLAVKSKDNQDCFVEEAETVESGNKLRAKSVPSEMFVVDRLSQVFDEVSVHDRSSITGRFEPEEDGMQPDSLQSVEDSDTSEKPTLAPPVVEGFQPESFPNSPATEIPTSFAPNQSFLPLPGDVLPIPKTKMSDSVDSSTQTDPASAVNPQYVPDSARPQLSQTSAAYASYGSDDVFQKSVHEGLVVVQKSESTKDEAIEAEVAKRVKGATEHLEEQWVEKLRSQEIDLQIQYDQQRKEYQQQMEHQCQKQVEAVRHESHVAFVAAVRKMRRKLEGKQKRGKEKHSLGGPRKQTDGAGDQATSRISEADDENLGERVEQLNKENQELAEVRDVLLEQIAISQTQGLRHTLRHELQQAFVTGRGKISPSQSLKSVTAAAEDPVAAEKMSVSPASQAEARQLIVADSQHSVFSMSSGSGASHSSEDTVQAGAVLKMEMEEEDEASLCEDGLETSSARERFLEELEEMSQQSSQDLPLEWELTSTTVSHSSASAGGFEHDQLGTGSVWEVFDGRCMRQDCREVRHRYHTLFRWLSRACSLATTTSGGEGSDSRVGDGAAEQDWPKSQDDEENVQGEDGWVADDELELDSATFDDVLQSNQSIFEALLTKASNAGAHSKHEDRQQSHSLDTNLLNQLASVESQKINIEQRLSENPELLGRERDELQEQGNALQVQCESVEESNSMMQEKCTALEEVIKTLQENEQLLQAERKRFKGSEHSLQDECKTLKEHEQSLQEELAVVKAHEQELREECRILKERERSLQDECESLKKNELSLQEECRVLKEEEQTLQEECSSLKETKRILQEECRVLKEKEESLEEEFRILEESYNVLQKSHDTLQEKAESLDRARSSLLEACKPAESKRSVLRSEDTTTEEGSEASALEESSLSVGDDASETSYRRWDTLSLTSVEEDRASQAHSDIEDRCTFLQERYDVLQKKYSKLKETYRVMKRDFESMEETTITQRRRLRYLLEIQEKYEELLENNRKLTVKICKLEERKRALIERCEALEECYRSQQKKNEKLKEECRVFQIKSSSVTSVQEQFRSLQQQHESLKDACTSLQDECKSLKEQLQEETLAGQEVRQQLHEQSVTLENVISEMRVDPMQVSVHSASSSLSSTGQAGTGGEALSSGYAGDISQESSSSVLDTTLHIRRLEKTLALREQTIKELEKKIQSQQTGDGSLSASQDLNEDLGNQVAELEQILTEKEDLIAELKERMVLLMKQQEELLPLVGLGGDADTPGKKVVTLKEQMVEKENKIQELQETFDLLLQNHADLRKKVKEDKKLEQQIKVRERALSEKERVITELREECRRLQQNLFAEKHKNGDLNSSVDSSQACGIDRQEQIIPEEETKRAQVRLTDLLPKPGEATSERSFESDSIAISSDPDSDITPGVDVDIVREMGRLRKDIKKTKAVYANESALLQEALDREKLSQSRVRSSKSPSLSRDFTEMTPSDIPDDPEALKKMVVKLLEENKQLTTENLRLQLRIREQEALVVEMEEKLKKVLKSPDDWQSMFERQLLLLQKQRDELLQQIHERDASIGRLSQRLGGEAVGEEALSHYRESLTEKVGELEHCHQVIQQRQAELAHCQAEKRHLEQLLLLKDEMERQLMRQKRLLEEELASIEGKLQEREATLVEEKARLLTELKEKDMRIFQLQTSQLNSPQMQSSVTSVSEPQFQAGSTGGAQVTSTPLRGLQSQVSRVLNLQLPGIELPQQGRDQHDGLFHDASSGFPPTLHSTDLGLAQDPAFGTLPALQGRVFRRHSIGASYRRPQRQVPSDPEELHRYHSEAVELLRSKLQLEMEIAQLSENQASAVTSYWQRHNKQVP